MNTLHLKPLDDIDVAGDTVDFSNEDGSVFVTLYSSETAREEGIPNGIREADDGVFEGVVDGELFTREAIEKVFRELNASPVARGRTFVLDLNG